MALGEYFRNFENHHQISLIGPLCESSFQFDEPIIYVDGGTNFRDGDKGISVGDGDSFDGSIDVPLNTQKDFSDLAFVLDHIPEHFCEINLIGFLGGRRDHELINIGEAHRFLCTRPIPTTFCFDNEIIGYSAGSWEIVRHGLFSIISLAETKVSITGDCLYRCPEKTRFTTISSLGLSNQGHGAIYIVCEGPVFILLEET